MKAARSCLALAAIGIAALVGCGKSAEVSQYRVPKEPPETPPTAAVAETAETTETTDRMLAAIVPVDGTAWTFKLTGPAETIGKHVDEFAGLIKSITFPSDAGGKPSWKLPEGWTQRAGGGQMRFATITIPNEKPPEKPLELTVSSVPWPAGDDSKLLLMNVNRWRGQMQLKPVNEDKLADSVRSLKFADGEAAVVDLVGKFKTGGMSPPFAGKMAGGASGSLPAGHTDISSSDVHSTDLPHGHPPVSDSAESPNSRRATPSGEPSKKASTSEDQSQLPFTIATPKGWHQAELPQFAAAAFAAGEAEKQVVVTVTPMFGPGGDLLMNVNRWRSQQLGLSPITADELSSYADPYKVDGKAAHLIRLFGPESATPQPGIEATMIQDGESTWIFKMRGTAQAVKDQQDNFQKLIDSIKFK